MGIHDDSQGREVCLRCHRPAPVCVCRHFEGVPRVANRTGIFLLQHPRERFHPLGTARIALLGLARVRLDVAWGLTHEPALPEGTALLYPHPRSRALEQLPPDERPANLLLLDGTWRNVRGIYRANPWLTALPHVQLRPEAPGRYRIRGEPDRYGRSTIEAIVHALRILEPHTAGLEPLLAIFDAAIDAQVALMQGRSAGPRRKRRRRAARPVPAALTERHDSVVVAYGESAPGADGKHQLVQWTALRPATNETFERFLRSGSSPPDPRYLAHMQLTPGEISPGIGRERFAAEWTAFLGQRAVLATWNQSSMDLIQAHAPGAHETVVLKAVYCNLSHAASGSLEAVVGREGLQPLPTPFAGRAGQRMGCALAVLEHLRHSAP